MKYIRRYFRPCCQKREDLNLDFGFQGDTKLVLLLTKLDLEVGEAVSKHWIDSKLFTVGSFCGYGECNQYMYTWHNR